MIRSALAFCLLLPALPLQAEALLIDSAQSQATFELRALWIKRIHGDFGQVEGLIERDVSRGRFGVDVRIAASSVRMDKDSHAAWARSADFFDAARHPWIRFRAGEQPDRLLHEGGELRGELSLRGVVRPVAFRIDASACPRPGLDCVVHARGEVQRSQFGMDARRLVLGDKVTLGFAIRVHRGSAGP